MGSGSVVERTGAEDSRGVIRDSPVPVELKKSSIIEPERLPK
jgi:hypothetical protein